MKTDDFDLRLAFGMAAGSLFLSLHQVVVSEIAKGTIEATANQSWLFSAVYFPVMLFKETSIMSWVIIAFGLYQAFVMPAVPKVKV